MSATSASCRPRSVPEARIAWRPSRCLLAAILVLGLLAPLGVVVSEMPRPLAGPLAVLAMLHAAWLFRRERARPLQSFVLRGDPAAVQVDGASVEAFELQWRGPLVFASWQDAQGRRQRCAWWPDTLPVARRRELRLAAPAPRAARGRVSMAP